MVAKKCRKYFHGPKTGIFSDIDNGVMEYICQPCDDGCAISYEMIQNKAWEIACTLIIRASKFKASSGWVIHFTRTHSLSL